MVVTVSNQYGTGAVAIAQRVAAELGYGFVDRELPVVVAKRLNVPVDVVEENEDSGRSIGERLLTSLEMATPELAPSTTIAQPFDETLGERRAEVAPGERYAFDTRAGHCWRKALAYGFNFGQFGHVRLGVRQRRQRQALSLPSEARIAARNVAPYFFSFASPTP